MANEITIGYPSGRDDIYGVLRKKTGKVYDTTVSPYHSTNSWVDWNGPDVGDYDGDCTGQGGNMYVFVFPSAITDAGEYILFIRRGDPPADGDRTIPGGAVEIIWDGTNIINLPTYTISEPDVGAMPPSPTIIQALNYIYRVIRNKNVTDKGPPSKRIIYKDDGSTKMTEAALTDDGLLFTKGKFEIP